MFPLKLSCFGGFDELNAATKRLTQSPALRIIRASFKGISVPFVSAQDSPFRRYYLSPNDPSDSGLADIRMRREQVQSVWTLLLVGNLKQNLNNQISFLLFNS